MYGKFTCETKIGNVILDAVKCFRGTRQSCGSSTIIFNLFINDLTEYLVWTNLQCPKSEAAVTVRPKSVSCSKQVYQNRLARGNYMT